MNIGTAGVLFNDSVTVTTTAAPLSTTTKTIMSVMIQNDPASTVNVLIGTATSQTLKLVPGANATIEIDYLSKVYAKTASGTATVNYLTLTT